MYEANVKLALTHLNRIMEVSAVVNIQLLMTTLNRLYYFLVNSGALTSVYLATFIKLGGMSVLRRLQEYCIGARPKFKKADYDEARYIISLLILSLYKHFRLNDNFEQTSNPFVMFASQKVVILQGWLCRVPKRVTSNGKRHRTGDRIG